ncbi:MAG TPA: Gfo/Idh/MocA family oxidoreductase [Lentisphaeria bacterium]|nr:Gfo/Idh/MocA family oxidoreductase [Lentisphaeria bacterium]
MSKKVKIGIIGAGTIGSVHADAYAKVADAEVVALCDILPERLKEKAARHQIAKTYATHQLLLADPSIDAVSVCVPNCAHAPIAIDAFKAGKHVLLEKPMTMNAKLGRDICKARDAAGKLLQMGMVRRQSPEAEVIQQAIAKGRLGGIYQINIKQIRRRGIPGLGGWFTTKSQSGGGALIDIAVHSIDLAMWVTGLWNPTRVSAKTYSKFGSPMRDYRYVSMWAGPPNYKGKFDVDDYVAGIVRFGKQATMSLEVAWACNSEPVNYIEFLGDKGGIRLGAGDPILMTEMDGYQADVKLIYDNKRDAFAAEMAKFVAAIQGKGEVPATGEEGVIVMSLLDAIYKSSEKDQEVAVEIP